ncbi:MAG: hypothetical protein M3135_02455, partial [Actinomycetota bacterium]|nr:hypothetical protein [Actinomycetota bacterium]
MKDRASRVSGHRFVLVAAMALIAIGLPSSPASAAVIAPTVFTDDLTDNGNCTLREAIAAATFDMGTDQCPPGSGTDTIQLQSGVYELSLTGSGEDLNDDGDLDVRETIDIVGTGMASTVIEGNGSTTGERVFHLPDGTDGDLSLTDLTVQHGGDGNDTGAGIRAGAGTVLDLLRVSVLANNAGTGDGGGIENTGTATLIDSRVALTPASDEGGGIDSSIPGTLTLERVTIDHNTSTRSGGGIFLDGDALTMTNVTVSNNTSGEDGGGLDVGSGPTVMNNVTITGNTADADDTDNGDGGGLSGDEITLRNSIVAGNVDATSSPGAIATDCSTTDSTSGGHNILGVADECGITPATGDKFGTAAAPVDPMLGPLADNGGLTVTHALLPGSPAIDAAGADAAPTDQRGVPRGPDIGAYEFALCKKVVVNRVGTVGNDVLTGTSGADGFLAQDGNDRATGLAGNDAACMGGGKDTASGGGGKDTLLGEAGKDKLKG